MLKIAYNTGIKVALAHFKLATGSSAGATPMSSLSHGTERIPYATRAYSRTNADVAEHMPQGQFNSDWLWNNQDLSHMAPGNVSGFGQEVIG